MTIPEEKVVYNDFGELMEKRLFGGMIEARFHDEDSFMDFQRNALYKSKADNYGFEVKIGETISKIQSGTDFSFVLGDEFESKKTKSFARAALFVESGIHRLSRARADSDACEDRGDEIVDDDIDDEDLTSEIEGGQVDSEMYRT